MKGKRKSKGQAQLLEEQQQFIQKISDKIRRLRQEAGYSSHETFAFEHDIDRTQWSKMERGVDMKLSTLYRALDALGITPEDFFMGFDK